MTKSRDKTVILLQQQILHSPPPPPSFFSWCACVIVFLHHSHSVEFKDINCYPYIHDIQDQISW